MRNPLGRRTALVAVALAAAGPLSAQIVVRTLQRDSLGVTRDSTLTMRVLRTGGQDTLLMRIDSVFRRLEHEPLGSAERVQLEATIQQLMTRLTASARWSGEVGVRIGAAVSENVRDAFARAMIEQGELRRFRSFMPQGWIGIVAEGPRLRQIVRENEVIRYFSYPSIVSVEPNSPAERAGILAGDTLVAYDRADVRDREINLSRLLIPDRRLAVTVRRDGDTKEYQMVVAKAPEEFVRARFEIAGMMPDSLMRGNVTFLGSPERRGFAGARAGGGMVASGPIARPEGLFTVPRPPTAVVFPRPVDGVWGAQLATIEGGLARTLGVKTGVLVTAVAPATPASSSGLESGDIIVRVDGRQLVSVEELRRAAVDHRHDHAVELQVQRAKKLKTITVRWPL